MRMAARMDRRTLIRLVGLGAVAAPVTRAFSAKATAPFRLRYILASSLYGTTKLEEILPEVRKTGARQIDIWPRPHADQREQIKAMGDERFAELLRRHKVELGVLTCYDLGPFGLQEEMRFARKFGAKMLITGSRGPKDLAGAECKRAVQQFVEQMKPHVAVAEEMGLTIGIENHAGALVSTPDSLRYLGELAGSRHLGVAMAPYHLPQNAQELGRLIEDLGPQLAHFYAWQYGQGCMKKLPKPQELEQLPGLGKLDFKPLLAALKKIAYAGWTEIFMHPVPRGIPIMETTAQVTEEIVRARQYLERCLSGSQ